MVFSDLSTLNAVLIVKTDDATITIDNYDPDSDIFGLNDRETADGEVTPDGYFNGWCKRTPIETNFTCTGASKGGKQLQGLLNAQASGKLLNVTIVVQNLDETTTYGPGVLLSAKPAAHLGNQKVQPVTFHFKFGDLTSA